MPIYFVVFMVIILPALIILEGLKMFFSFVTNRKGGLWNLIYAFIAILVFLVIILFLLGYRY